ncbi:MAG: mechanosensitive ion channel protein MscS [Clostridiales bacterium GWF2_38_85]|nr:MAG: mechanosensitive ion channel protein MscS [Clostridiales bacterium GWF2_38_85]HBL84628.1 mechanosensitive ion channel protein MscS [Clostridiales bacterium]
MVDFFTKLFENTGLDSNFSETIAYIAAAVIVIVICVLARIIAKYVIVKISAKSAKKTKFTWDNVLFEKRFFHRISHLTVPIVISFFTKTFEEYDGFVSKFIAVYSIIVVIWIADSILNTVDEIYRSYEISKVRPIKGFLQVIKVVIIAIGVIIGIAALIGQNPIVLLGGFGALTAVITLVFKDAILGFVAGIQLTSNNMIRIGDWIEMPKYSADGDVIELSLTTVKVQNFDKTITTIPAYALISDSFINWRGMVNTGGRRIKRAVYIDTNGIKLCDDEMIARFDKIEYLKDYIGRKKEDIGKFNAENKFDLSEPVNGRRLTNIGTFRAYITEYLKHHPGIHQEMTLMVRQLAVGTTGVPLEIYAFTNTTDWEKYEGIQSDIFDHLLAVVSRFGLSIYQQPSGRDIADAAAHIK